MKTFLCIVISYSIILLPSCKRRKESSSAKDIPNFPTLSDISSLNERGKIRYAEILTEINKTMKQESHIVIVDNRTGKRLKPNNRDLFGNSSIKDNQQYYVGTTSSRYLLSVHFPTAHQMELRKHSSNYITIKQFDTERRKQRNGMTYFAQVGGMSIKLPSEDAYAYSPNTYREQATKSIQALQSFIHRHYDIEEKNRLKNVYASESKEVSKLIQQTKDPTEIGMMSLSILFGLYLIEGLALLTLSTDTLSKSSYFWWSIRKNILVKIGISFVLTAIIVIVRGVSSQVMIDKLRRQSDEYEALYESFTD